MSFVFPILLGGLGLTAIPVLLHLIMRQKPRILPFPAFRFLIQKHRKNLRKLRLRHLLLLALRILLIAAVCLALARPRLLQEGLNLSSERPLAAIFLFDTSSSMEYQTSDRQSRLEEARKRGLEMLADLPDGSRIAVLDTAEPHLSARGEWLSAAAAGDRIKNLKIQPANASVSVRLEDAYRLFAELAGSSAEPTNKKLPRFLAVFSDRTRACWDPGRQMNLYDAVDRVPPAPEGLTRARSDIPPLADLLKELRQRLPPGPGQDYPEAALLDALDKLRDEVPRLTEDDLGGPELENLLRLCRARGRELVKALDMPADKVPAEARDYRDKLLAALHTVLRDLAGVHAVFVDVGVDSPVDLAILSLGLPRQSDGNPRQIYSADEKFVLQAMVQATGKDYRSELICQGALTAKQPVDIKAGERKVVPFEIDARELRLGPGPHQLEVRLATTDLLPFNNAAFVTFAIREPRRAVIIADDPAKAHYFRKALRSVGFSPEDRTPAEVQAQTLAGAPVVFLFEVAEPGAGLWAELKKYVQAGGGLGVVPGGSELKTKAYNAGPAQEILPGTLTKLIDGRKAGGRYPGATWDLADESIFQHPVLRPFRDWRGTEVDVVRNPGSAFSFWEVQPVPMDGLPLVRYSFAGQNPGYPALLERQVAGAGKPGRVLLYTVPLDGDPAWSDYLKTTERTTYLVLVALTADYLAGGRTAVKLNFRSGDAEPVVAIPALPRYPIYTVRGPELFEPVPVGEAQTEVTVRRAKAPGNYTIEGGDGTVSKRLAAFSVQMPPEESDLTRVPPAEIENVLGKESVVPVGRGVNLRDAIRGHWSEPVELFPFLMVLLLLLLALESLLANKFYRAEPSGS